MSQKQTDHRNHYISSLGELPEDQTIIPSNVTPIEELGICLVDNEEAKTLDSEGEDEGEDELTPEELKAQFFGIIAELQRRFPSYSPTDFKKYLEENRGMTEQLKILRENFHESFKDVDKNDPEYINLLIGLSSIGIEIPKDEGEDEVEAKDEVEDEGKDEDEVEGEDEGELAKSIALINLDETVTDV